MQIHIYKNKYIYLHIQNKYIYTFVLIYFQILHYTFKYWYLNIYIQISIYIYLIIKKQKYSFKIWSKCTNVQSVKVIIWEDTKRIAAKLHNFSIYSMLFLYITQGCAFWNLGNTKDPWKALNNQVQGVIHFTLGKCPGFQGFKRVHNTLLQPHDFSIYSKFFVNKEKDNKRHSEIPCEFPMWAPIRILTWNHQNALFWEKKLNKKAFLLNFQFRLQFPI